MTQTQYDQAHEEATQAIRDYASGLVLLFEFQDRIAALTTPRPVSHAGLNLVDPATGLRF